ncbi:MAG TPA: nitrate/sulfonate/bicarbonate ABC transporter ATP-binding protein [Gammaproteobacteria bacterium]|nr:nitrate/sulfonate/bicarbonate ABC transporter ATP-binding protein [Gammaproteobacteria bacterium]
MDNASPIISVDNLRHTFKRGDQEAVVLDNVNIKLYPGEITALIGTSGSGKSTLLRILAGLIKPTQGSVRWYDAQLTGPVPGLSMVFQHFALMPWLTVLQNVELGLEAKGVPREERRARALRAIDVIGMDGFESAYPKELSGGMCQRVGLARALVVDPEVILMDEPFSALDVLTAENLRNDLIDLWQSEKTRLKSIFLVTHNIEEAVLMADRILVFSNNPGSIFESMKIPLAHPRQPNHQDFEACVDSIYQAITKANTKRRQQTDAHLHLDYRIPSVEVSSMTGFLEELLDERNERSDLSELADEHHLDLDELLPITEALELLKLAELSEGYIELSTAGKQLAEASILDRKKIFASQILNYIPLIRHIRSQLQQDPNHSIHESVFLDLIGDKLSEEASREVLRVVIEWGRYAEVFAYNVHSGHLTLEDPN